MLKCSAHRGVVIKNLVYFQLFVIPDQTSQMYAEMQA